MRTLSALVFCFLVCPAHADDSYPRKPIRMIVPVAPGGGADITARALTQKLSEARGQQVLVDNRAGAGGTVGMELGSRATPDGYTIVEGSMGPVAVDINLYDKLGYDPVRDFVPIARAVSALNTRRTSIAARALGQGPDQQRTSQSAEAQFRFIRRRPRGPPGRAVIQYACRREYAARAL